MATDELDIELEALEHTFYDDENRLDIIRVNEAGVVVSARLEPRTGLEGRDASHFVLCTLRLEVDPSTYPETLPTITLLDIKGLGDARQAALLSLLKQEAEELRGMMMLGHLVESATSWLTEHNYPEGDCAFCLNSMADGNQGMGASATLTRLPCFHAFHSVCYCRWWAWQQADCAQRERELVQHTGARAAATIMSDKMPPRESPPQQHLYCSSCPVCRTASPLSDLAHLLPQLEQALRQHTSQGGRASSAGSEPAQGSGDTSNLQGPELQRVKALQQRHQRLWQKQVAANGIISAPASYLLPTAQGSSGGGGAQSEGDITAVGSADQNLQSADRQGSSVAVDAALSNLRVSQDVQGTRGPADRVHGSGPGRRPSPGTVSYAEGGGGARHGRHGGGKGGADPIRRLGAEARRSGFGANRNEGQAMQATGRGAVRGAGMEKGAADNKPRDGPHLPGRQEPTY